MEKPSDPPQRNVPPYHLTSVQKYKEEYWDKILTKFVDEYLLPPSSNHQYEPAQIRPDSVANQEDSDLVLNHSLLVLRYFFILADFKDAVKEGNGKRINEIHKQLLHIFKTDKGYNAYAIEMFVNIMQNDVLLSEAQQHQCTWAATANWKGGPGGNVEIDLLQENRNRDLKNIIKGMGANKTNKSIERASKAIGGVRKIVENFEQQVSKKQQSTHHTHKSSQSDEAIILNDLHQLKPFTVKQGRLHASFNNIAPDPLCGVNQDEFSIWLERHKKNLLYSVPVDVAVTDEQDSEG